MKWGIKLLVSKAFVSGRLFNNLVGEPEIQKLEKSGRKVVEF